MRVCTLKEGPAAALAGGRTAGSRLREGEPTYLRLGMFGSLSLGVGGPTDDKPEVFASPPRDPNVLGIFLDLAELTSGVITTLGPRAGRNSSLSRKSMRQNCDVTCVIRMGYLIDVGYRQR
jgi:hypothetical protein